MAKSKKSKKEKKQPAQPKSGLAVRHGRLVHWVPWWTSTNSDFKSGLHKTVLSLRAGQSDTDVPACLLDTEKFITFKDRNPSTSLSHVTCIGCLANGHRPCW